jgi:hypothetical protein
LSRQRRLKDSNDVGDIDLITRARVEVSAISFLVAVVVSGRRRLFIGSLLERDRKGWLTIGQVAGPCECEASMHVLQRFLAATIAASLVSALFPALAHAAVAVDAPARETCG